MTPKQEEVPAAGGPNLAEHHGEVSTLRRLLPQVLASTAKNLILMDIGMSSAFPTIVIPALLHSQTGLSFTKTQASWFASIGFICQPLGCLLAGILLEPLGRKHSMMVVNLPQALGWYLFYIATSTNTIYCAAVIMGLGAGFMHNPIITYVGEISEPRFRGMLISYAGLFVTLGLVVIFAMGNLADWQNVAGICCTLPLITIALISQVPETPAWLVYRGRLQDAERALCWLRGWVDPRAVQQELARLVRYSEASRMCEARIESNSGNASYGKKNFTDDVGNTVIESIVHLEMNEKEIPDSRHNNCLLDDNVQNKTLKGISSNSKGYKGINPADKLSKWKMEVKDFMRPEMFRPLAFVIGFFFFVSSTGIEGTRPYLIKVFEKIHCPVTPKHAIVVMSTVQLVGNILCLVTVRWTGKKPMSCVSLLVCGIATTTMGLYILLGDPATRTGWLPFLMFITLQFFSGYGVSSTPWMLVSEVFPFRGRSAASGIAAASYYVLGFGATKTFLGLEDSLTLGGVFLMYGALTFCGVVFLLKFMVETEGRTLEDIEQDYKVKT